MTDQNESNQPTPNSSNQPLPERNVPALTVEQQEIREHTKNAADSDESKATKIEKDIRTGERWLIVITAVGVLLSAVIAVIYYGQLKEMRKATHASQKSADAATRAADIANDTLTNTQAEFRTEQRPFIWAKPRPTFETHYPNGITVRSVFEPPSASEPRYRVDIGIDIANAGKSPAIEVRATQSILKFGKVAVVTKDARNFVPDYPKVGSIVTPGPSSTVSSTVIYLSPADYDCVMKSLCRVYVVGAITYRDIFKPVIPPYETTYCFVVIPEELPFGDCEFGNSMR